MKTKERLISLMLAGSIATAGLISCDDNKKEVYANDIPERKNLTTALSEELRTEFTNVVSFEVVMNTGKHFIRFLIHFDNGKKNSSDTSTGYEYVDHKDYVVTYRISEEDYNKFAQFCTPGEKTKLAGLSSDKIAMLQNIVDNYDPWNFGITAVSDNTYGEHSR